jgi:hypothetical protein
MKRTVLNISLSLVMMVVLSSCFSYTYTVGNGPQTGVTISQKNHYVIYGLAPLKISDPVKMAGGAANYEVKIEHSIIDGLLYYLTFGIYTPTTTTVRK